jgi:hypothetical protein
MTNSDIAHLRLQNQYISSAAFEKPVDMVRWFGAVQAQDYLGALWAVGLRCRNASETDIERAIADRTIVRTWPMRGTLHFVATADAKWMLKLLTPRVVAVNAQRMRQYFGLDEATVARSKDLLAKALEGGRQLSRNAIYEVLEAGGISAVAGRGLHITQRLAQDGYLCFGAREGKQQTFALLDAWASNARALERDEALAELARRYFMSHGPATLQDFVWWSGLIVSQARAGIEMAKPHLVQEMIAGQPYWFSSSTQAATDTSKVAHLLPPFDEYTVAYKDRSAVMNPAYATKVNTGYGIFAPIIVINGQVIGTWKRAFKKNSVAITLSPFAKLRKTDMPAIEEAAERYGEFLNSAVEIIR